MLHLLTTFGISEVTNRNLLIAYAAWLAVGFWILLFTPLISHLSKSKSTIKYPRWWKILLFVYILSIVSVIVVGSIINREPAHVLLGFAYGSIFLMFPTIVISLIGAGIFMLYSFCKAGMKADKSELNGMIQRTLYVALAIFGVWVISYVINH